jgi:hypothetical protein
MLTEYDCSSVGVSVSPVSVGVDSVGVDSVGVDSAVGSELSPLLRQPANRPAPTTAPQDVRSSLREGVLGVVVSSDILFRLA